MLCSRIIPIAKNHALCIVRYDQGMMYYYYVEDNSFISKSHDDGIWKIKKLKP